MTGLGPGGSDDGDEVLVGGRRLVDLATATAAIGGYACTMVLLIVGFTRGIWSFPGGDVIHFYAPAGDALRAGGDVYFPGFLYGPPWAAAFAAVSWLGPTTIHVVILALDVVALWVIAMGSWRRLGIILWFPLISYEIAAGQLNLLVAAAIVSAQRGVVWPLAIVSLAKVWPALALPPRNWRRFLAYVGVFALVTLPWLDLWPQWIATLIETAPQPLGPVIPVPWIIRAAIAGVLLYFQQPWTRALAAAIVSPGLYWGQLVVLAAPASLWLARRELPQERRQ